MNKVTIHDGTVLQIKVPLPFPLRWVNSYLIRGSSGYTLIDPGLHTEEAKDTWLDALKQQNINFADISQIVLTHHHPDHYGLSGWFQAKTSAPVYMSELSYHQAVRLWGKDQTMNQEMYELFILHGMEAEAAAEIIPHFLSFIPMVSPQPEVSFLKPEGTLMMGDKEYLMITASGHAAGQLLFYNEQDQEIFCGDQVIPRLSPNVSYLPGVDANPLASFLYSLESLSRLSVKTAFPGHRDPFSTFTERAQEIILHHHERLEKMHALLCTPMTAYQVCQSVFGEKLSIHHLRFAMAETLAHMIYLQAAGKVFQTHNDGIIIFQAETD
jgi:glyoxylase-like metal-dependent hydrolase (beta-lactamase superfamily II)